MTSWVASQEIGAEFKVFEGPRSFLEAASECELENATLARVSNDKEYDFVLSLTDNLVFSEASEERIWIGNFGSTRKLGNAVTFSC